MGLVNTSVFKISARTWIRLKIIRICTLIGLSISLNISHIAYPLFPLKCVKIGLFSVEYWKLKGDKYFGAKLKIWSIIQSWYFVRVIKLLVLWDSFYHLFSNSSTFYSRSDSLFNQFIRAIYNNWRWSLPVHMFQHFPHHRAVRRIKILASTTV